MLATPSPKEHPGMKTLVTICMIVAATSAWAADQPARVPPGFTVITGEVLEIRDVESYTYLRLKTKDGETWAAVGRAPVGQGAVVTVEKAVAMKNFQSKTLQRVFPTIYFGTLAGAAGSTRGARSEMAAAHSGLASTPAAGDSQVSKATGANARTVAEIMTKSAELKDKPVLVRGKVVKYNPGIMGKNWIHLRDGSGSEANNTNDILVTSLNYAKVGDVVTVAGIVRTNKDFGAGYAYKVMVEDATLQK